MALSPADVRWLLESFESSSWREMTVRSGADTVHVSRSAQPSPRVNGEGGPDPVPAIPAPATPDQPAAEAANPPTAHAQAFRSELGRGTEVSAGGPADGTPIGSPTVGIFWHAPAPDQPPFVTAGDHVSVGDQLGIVEVMKLMTPVLSTVTGTVTTVLVNNGHAVEHGQPLLLVHPAT